MQIPETEIIVTKNGSELLRKTVRPGEYVIGRDAGCEFCVEVDQVAPRHAQLTVNFDHSLIEDLGSDAGTLVNGKPVMEPTRLWPNQKIQIGAATVELRRIKTVPPPDVSLAPSTAAVKRLLPEEFLREKKYDIGGVVAQGGMGAILNAKEANIERVVAMKVMLDSSSLDDLTRFVAEAKVTGQLEHPNIVPVHELGVDENDQVYYTMKFVKGITLRKVLEEMAAGNAETLQNYPLPVLLTIFQKVCDAIAFAHSKGVIHRDLKPENIMLGDFGEALVMDWGLAKVVGSNQLSVISNQSGSQPPTEHCPLNTDHSASATLAGTVMGTPQYMAPEQARGEVEELDARADIYSFGAILYHLLALRPSVTGNDAWAMVAKVSEGEIEPLVGTPRRGAQVGMPLRGVQSEPGEVEGKKSGRLGDPSLPHLPGGRIPDSLAAVVRKAMAFERDKRYAHVADLQRDIGAYQGGFATSAENAGAWKQFTLLVKRNKAASLGVAAVLLVGGVLGTKAILEGRRATREAVRAQRGEALAQSEATHAKNEAERAERGEAAAKATLADLRRTAPVFYAQAKVDFEEGNFDAAIEKIGYAIQLDDTAADYHLFRANLRECSQDLTAAAEGYRRVLALRPADAAAKTNLALYEKLLRESGGAALKLDQQRQLLAALRTQKRLVDSAPLAALIDPNTATARAALMSRLHEWVKQPGWTANVTRVAALPDGTFNVNLLGLAPGDFSVLKGQPVSVLDLDKTGITDLSSLAGLPLKELDLQFAKATDLSPLRGMPLESLDLRSVPVTDLSPLRGMKLHTLDLYSTSVSDLSPLAGMPLTSLDCSDCPAVRDISPLRGAPLRTLKIRGAPVTSLAPLAGAPLKGLVLDAIATTDLTPLGQCVDLENLNLRRTPVADLTALAKLHLTSLDLSDTKVTSLAPLRGQPLRYLDLRTPGLKDLTPLSDCPALEEIILPNTGADPTPLRGLPRLRFISTRIVGAIGSNHPAQTAEEFWKEYDAQQAAGRQ